VIIPITLGECNSSDDITRINKKEVLIMNYDAFRYAVLPPVCLR